MSHVFTPPNPSEFRGRERGMTFQTKFTQQDDRKKRTAKHLCGTDLTGQSLVCFVIIFNSH